MPGRESIYGETSVGAYDHEIIKGLREEKKDMGGRLEGCNAGFSRTEAKEVADAVEAILAKFEACETVIMAGSYRRSRPMVNDLDLVVVITNLKHEKGLAEAMKTFGIEGWSDKRTNASIAWGLSDKKRKMQVDFFVVRSPASLSAEIMCWTGPFEANIAMRMRARKMGLKLSQRGLSKDGNMLSLRSEEEIYKKLGLPFIPPEKRDDFTSERAFDELVEQVKSGSYDAG